MREREKGREREKDNIHQLPPVPTLTETELETGACALTSHQTGNPFMHRTMFKPQGHTDQGWCCFVSPTSWALGLKTLLCRLQIWPMLRTAIQRSNCGN